MTDYGTELASRLPEEILRWRSARPNATLYTRFSSRSVSVDEINAGDAKAVFVIEDIDELWMSNIGSRLGIGTDVFAEHCRTGQDTWMTIMGATNAQTIQDLRKHYTCSANTWHVDGVFDSTQKRVGRHSSKTSYGSNLATRISFHRQQNVILILIDATAGILHLPVSKNRGGIIVSKLASEIKTFFAHQWHFNALFDPISPATFFHMLAVSAQLTSFSSIDNEVKQISFNGARAPTVSMNNRLHHLRHDLDLLRKEVKRLSQWMPEEVEKELRAKKTATNHIGSPDKSMKDMMRDMAQLDRFIMDSFMLLLSSISIQHAETSANTSRRAQQFTILAFIYVPFSFVTGIFGMNLAEINGSTTPAWIAGVTAVATVSLTSLVLAILYALRRL